MLQDNINIFKNHARSLLPNLFYLRGVALVQQLDDEALLQYMLIEPITIDELMDELEDFDDGSQIFMLYHHSMARGQTPGESCCAFSNPLRGYMYKVNAVAEGDGLVHTVDVTIYSSLDYMAESLLTELREKGKSGLFHHAMKDFEVLTLFVC